LSPGASYRVYATKIVDLLGNVILAPFNQKVFTAFTPPAPAGRNFKLVNALPLMNRLEDATGDLTKFVACLQEETDILLADCDRFLDILDPDLASSAVLDLMLLDLGNPFDFDLVEIDKRRLVQVLVDMYQLKGTGQGIINVVRFFLGVEVTVDEFNDDPDGLVLGESELGVNWSLGPATSFLRFSFKVVSPVVLTAKQRAQITDIANYMKPAHTHFVQLVEPVAPVVVDHLELGLSELGDEWILH
jgi:phage tail-like protein